MSTFRANHVAENVPSVDYPDPELDSVPEHLARSTASSRSKSQQDAFSCGLCDKVFNRRENLSRHLKTRMISSAISATCD